MRRLIEVGGLLLLALAGLTAAAMAVSGVDVGGPRPGTDAPVPPASHLDWFASAAVLALVPAIAVATVYGALAVSHPTDWRWWVGSWVVLATTTVFASVVLGYPDGEVVVELLAGYAVPVLAVAAVSHYRPPETVVGGVVLALSATALGAVAFLGATAVEVGGSLLSGHSPEALPHQTAVVLAGSLTYPFGIAVARAAWSRVIVAAGATATCIPAVVHFVPLPGGPAVLVVFAEAILFVVVLALYAPLFSLGYTATAPPDRVSEESRGR